MMTLKRNAARALSYALANGKAGQPDGVLPLLQQCAIYIDLHCPPAYETYDPAAFVRRHFEPAATEALAFAIEPVPDCRGSLRQLRECVQLFLDNIATDADTTLYFEVFQEKDTPCFSLSFEGVATVPEELRIGPCLSLTMHEFRQRWTGATAGGRIDPAPNGYIFRLKGIRMLPEIFEDLSPVRDKLDAAAAAEALDLLEGENTRREPADLKTLVNEVAAERRPELDEHNIDLNVMFASPPPPIAMYRDRVRDLLENLFDYALASINAGGDATFLFDYNPAARAAEAIVTFQGWTPHPNDDAFFASMERLVSDLHEGRFEKAAKAGEMTLVFSLPDRVGRAIEEWIPGFDAFSDRSKQVLRLLKSGGLNLPEDVLLAGVLEEELEQWLLPLLSQPPAVNYAHDLAESTQTKPLVSRERLKKALDQIKKGKPRKEIAKPPYAAEILHAFQRPERGHTALGLNTDSLPTAEKLSALLLVAQPAPAECLRLIAALRQK